MRLGKGRRSEGGALDRGGPLDRGGAGRTRTEKLSNTNAGQWERLVSALAVEEHPSSLFLRQEGEAEAALGGAVTRKLDPCIPLSPLVVPAQEELVRRWLEQRLEVKLDDSKPLAYALTSGILLRMLVDVGAWVPSAPLEGPWEGNMAESGLSKRELRKLRRRERRSGLPVPGKKAFLRKLGVWEERQIPLVYSYYTCARGISLFIQHVRSAGTDPSEIFELDDLLYYRNIPKVLRTIASFARREDYVNFAEIADTVNGASTTWTEEDEPSERWAGDRVISELVLSFKKVNTSRRLGILVVGAMGSGKSATIGTLLGRKACVQRHKMTLVTEDAYFNEDENFERRKRRDYLSDPLLRFKLEAGVNANVDVNKTHVKLHGVSVKITELPSMEEYVVGTADGQCLIQARAGDIEQVRNAVAADKFDVVLLVDRLDTDQSEPSEALCRSVNTLFGPRIWDFSVLVFTHGSALPPVDFSYPEYVTQSLRASQELVSKISGSYSSRLLPSAVIENSKSCPKQAGTGVPVLPDGSDFQKRLLNAMETVLLSQNGLPPLTSRKRRPWWETWVIGGVIIWIVTFRL